MKIKTFLLLIAISSYLSVLAKESPLFFDTPAQGKVLLLPVGKYSYCIANNTIYQIEKKKLVQKATVTGTCNDAVVYNNNIALATSQGILLFNTTTNAVAPYLHEAVSGIVNEIETDNSNHLWFTKVFEGCFMIDDNNLVQQRVRVPVTYALAYTGNGNMWVGTNVGLYKVPVKGGDIVRYAEEGIASNELPDNLVERLFTDAHYNVWVMMPGHLSFIAANGEEEFPDYEEIGKKDNALYHITAAGKGYLFATAQGILLMRSLTHGEELHTGEIHQTINEQAYLLTDAITGRPAALKNEVITQIKNCGSQTYFITNSGLWSVNTAKFDRALKSYYGI